MAEPKANVNSQGSWRIALGQDFLIESGSIIVTISISISGGSIDYQWRRGITSEPQ